MLVGVSINNDNLETVTSATYNGAPLTFVASETQSDDARIEILKLVKPPLRGHNVLIDFSADLKRYAVAGVTYAAEGSQVTISASLEARDHWAFGGISIKPIRSR